MINLNCLGLQKSMIIKTYLVLWLHGIIAYLCRSNNKVSSWTCYSLTVKFLKLELFSSFGLSGSWLRIPFSLEWILKSSLIYVCTVWQELFSSDQTVHIMGIAPDMKITWLVFKISFLKRKFSFLISCNFFVLIGSISVRHYQWVQKQLFSWRKKKIVVFIWKGMP